MDYGFHGLVIPNELHVSWKKDYMTKKEKLALAEAVKVIYFHDRSDYLPILWAIVGILGGEKAKQLLLENESEAVRKYGMLGE